MDITSVFSNRKYDITIEYLNVIKTYWVIIMRYTYCEHLVKPCRYINLRDSHDTNSDGFSIFI